MRPDRTKRIRPAWRPRQMKSDAGSCRLAVAYALQRRADSAFD